MSVFQSHPFPVSAYFDRVVAISFAFPEESLKKFLSPGLRLDTYNGLGFITVAMVWTKQMRPTIFPKMLGRSFFLAGYRVFVKYTNAQGKNLRGLQILKSETDSRFMAMTGNLFTRYKYSFVDVDIESTLERDLILVSGKEEFSGCEIVIQKHSHEVSLPANSPFPDWHEARKYAGPMLYTFSYDPDRKAMVIVKGSREDWQPTPVSIEVNRIGFFDKPIFFDMPKPLMANAFQVKNVEYAWSKGAIESVSP